MVSEGRYLTGDDGDYGDSAEDANTGPEDRNEVADILRL